MSPRASGTLRAEAAALESTGWAMLAAGAALGFGISAFGISAHGVSVFGVSAGGGAPAALTLCAGAAYGAWSAWLTITDVRDRRLPNPVVAWAAASVVGLLAAALLVLGDAPRLFAAGALSLGIGLAGLILWLCWPGLLGAGDVKLLPPTVFPVAVVAPDLVGTGYPAAVCLGVILTLLVGRGRGRGAGGTARTSAAGAARTRAARTDIPFGPVLLGASWANLALAAAGAR